LLWRGRVRAANLSEGPGLPLADCSPGAD